VQAHDVSLKAYLRGSFPAVRDVDDVVRESYLRVWRARATQPIVSAKAFLFQVARRLALDVIRRERHDFVAEVRDFADSNVSSATTGGAEMAAERERVQLLSDAIETLPARCREIFIMRKIQDISQRDTAERLGLSPRTVEVQVSRAMKRCAEYLRRHGVTGFDE
jgi:RNA polymerase sigma factor (sigma-70 family)